MPTKITHDLPLGDPPTPPSRRTLDGAAQVAAIERRYGYSLRVPTAPADVRRTGPDAQLHATIVALRAALAAAENRILALEQELSLLQSGPGEEDGPWAKGWDNRRS